VSVYDAGNVVCEGDHLEAAQTELGHQVDELLAARQFPIVLGGGHELSFGVWQGLAAYASRQDKTPVIGILSLDAQLHLHASPQAHCGTPFRQIADECAARGWPFRYACLGVAEPANTVSLFERAHQLGVTWLTDKALRQWQPATLHRFIDESDWLYLSIDLEVLPAAVAPGVSEPAAYGVELAVVEAIADQVRESGKLKVAEIAGLNPRHDVDGQTARVAARLVYQLTI
jgi:formiminoglutamase